MKSVNCEIHKEVVAGWLEDLYWQLSRSIGKHIDPPVDEQIRRQVGETLGEITKG